jgi:hypothetical protein
MLLTYILTLSISNTWDEWFQTFDSNQTCELHDRYGMQVIFRGFSPKNQKQVVVVVQASEEALASFFNDNKNYLKSNGVLIDSIDSSIWIG